MNIRRKSMINAAIAIIVTLLFVFFIRGFAYSHSTKYDPQYYSWLLKDSIKNEIINNVSIGDFRESDNHYTYNYKKNHITICEFKELSFMKISEITFKQNFDFSQFKDKFTGEVLNLNLSPEINMKFKLPFHNSFCVNLDNNSKIIKWIEGKNYRGFFGNISQMSLSNAQGEDLVLFNYKQEATPTLFLIYKFEGRFILILINSDDKFDDSIINILKLE